MDYGLKRLVWGSNKFVPLSKEEYCDIKRATELVREALFIEEKFDLVVDNFLELETDLLDSVAREMVRGVENWTAFQGERNLMNRRVINLLASARLYIDHTSHHVSSIASNDASLGAAIEATISAQYDRSLGYRAMEALRNYVQHRAYPIHGVTFHGKWIENRTKLMYAVTPYMKPEQLKEDGKFKTATLEELKALGEKIDIKPLMREYVEGIGHIHSQVREHLKPLVDESERIIRDAIERYRNAEPKEESLLGLAAACRKSEHTYSEDVWLSDEPLDYRRAFERKNRSLHNLSNRHVSSEIVPPG